MPKLKQTKGYTVGSFDLFHIGHLNIIQQAKTQCDYLIVGVNSDETIARCKGKQPIVPFAERAAIIAAIGDVDEVVKVECEATGQKADDWHLRLSSDVVVAASDAKDLPEWKELVQLKLQGTGKVVFFPYTQTTSSTALREALYNQID